MKEPEETSWRTHLTHLVGKPGIQGAEIGTFKGESAEWMLKNIFTSPTARYYCIDPFTGGDDQIKLGIDCSNLEKLARERLAPYSQAVIIPQRSQIALRTMNQNCLDFLYIDGSHIAADVLEDSVLGFSLLKAGGVIIWDDYLWDIVPDELDRPRPAIDAFLKIYSRRIKVKSAGWQIVAVKLN
jgi:predicted O-methyltransferase YrrM